MYAILRSRMDYPTIPFHTSHTVSQPFLMHPYSILCPYPTSHRATWVVNVMFKEPLSRGQTLTQNVSSMHPPPAPQRDTRLFHSTPGERERAVEKGILGENLFHITF